MNMDEICGTCGRRYGEHYGERCPPLGQTTSTFAPTGHYRADTGGEKAPEPASASYQFKEGTTLQDLLNTRPCLEEFSRFMDMAGFAALHPAATLDNKACDEAANSNPEWQDYGLKHGLLEKVEQPLSLRLEVDGKTVWEGEGTELAVAENGWWVVELTKEGVERTEGVKGTNIANDGSRILEQN